MKNIITSIVLLCQLFVGMGIPTLANASTPVNTIPSASFMAMLKGAPVVSTAGASNPAFLKKMYMSMGDARYVKGQSGAVMLNIPAGQAADVIYTQLGTGKQVWAAFNPAGNLGRIQAVWAEKLPKDRGAVTVVWQEFSPKTAGPKAVKDRIHSVDPYAHFASAADDMWHNIKLDAFLIAVSKAMLKYHTPVSYVTIPEVKQEQGVSSSDSLLTASTTTTVISNVTPRWIFGVPSDVGGQQAFRPVPYKIPACNPMFEPKPKGEANPRNCIVMSAANFVPMFGGNMPEDTYLADVQSITVSSWSFIAQIVFTGVLCAVTAGLAGPAFMAASGTSIGMGMAGVVGSATYAGVSAALSNGKCLTCAQGTWFGALGDGTSAVQPVQGGFGDPTAAISNNFVKPGVTGNLQGGQKKMWNLERPSVWNTNSDPGLIKASPPKASGIMSNFPQ